MMAGDIFVPVNDKTAFDLFCRSSDDLITSGTVGSQRLLDDADLANEYYMAASLLVDAAVEKHRVWMCVHPILYLYRHAIELELKGLVRPQKPNHDLDTLTNALIKNFSDAHNIDIAAGWVVKIIREFSAIDKRSTGFRYVKELGGERIHASEYEVDVKALKEKLEPLFLLFLTLRMQRLGQQSENGDTL
jgi:hypothetical protein